MLHSVPPLERPKTLCLCMQVYTACSSSLPGCRSRPLSALRYGRRYRILPAPLGPSMLEDDRDSGIQKQQLRACESWCRCSPSSPSLDLGYEDAVLLQQAAQKIGTGRSGHHGHDDEATRLALPATMPSQRCTPISHKLRYWFFRLSPGTRITCCSSYCVNWTLGACCAANRSATFRCQHKVVILVLTPGTAGVRRAEAPHRRKRALGVHDRTRYKRDDRRTADRWSDRSGEDSGAAEVRCTTVCRPSDSERRQKGVRGERLVGGAKGCRPSRLLSNGVRSESWMDAGCACVAFRPRWPGSTEMGCSARGWSGVSGC
ncbi:hypothetical protein LXA43DRAFT_496611 [Ganoderma leucocontextum]|nr:hypothetical protein LXA43DRAFT_496611 [Ganoderma leucocontextum]